MPQNKQQNSPQMQAALDDYAKAVMGLNIGVALVANEAQGVRHMAQAQRVAEIERIASALRALWPRRDFDAAKAVQP